jgi:hypothetical protein
MMRTMWFSALMFLVAAGLYWLSEVDRMSPLALSVVELDGWLGLPLWLVAGTLAMSWGVRLLVKAVTPPPPAPPARPLTRDAGRVVPFPGGAPGAAAPAGPDWFALLREQSRQISDDAMGRVRFDETPEVPFTLVLTGVTHEQARRRIAAFAAWLATIPTPPVARVRVVSSPDIEGPLHGLFKGELARNFPPDAVTVMSRADGTDARFARPDRRWSERRAEDAQKPR